MHVRLQYPGNDFNAYISGDVIIAPSAAIASGVLLQASPNSRIVIGPGVCIGMGAILTADGGTLEVEAGANLGAGVLVVGKGKIGANACIGATTTILNRSIEPGEVVLAGSLIGDESRQADPSVEMVIEVKSESSHASTAAILNGNNSKLAKDLTVTAASTDSTQVIPEPTESVPESSRSGVKVYGQAHLNRMLSTMFPHRQALNSPLQDEPPPSDQT